MSLSARVEELARAVVCLDATDLPALVRLEDELTDLASSIEEPELSTLASVCRHAAEGVERLVLRSVEDVEGELAKIRQAIEYAQEVVDASLSGAGAASVAAPELLRAQSGDEAGVDLELLAAWISSCGSALCELESAAVAIEAGEDAGREAEARRIIHTIKGEAGILSLDAIQRVCHECETLIDARGGRGEGFPVEEVLAIVDWVRACIAALTQSPSAELPDHSRLLSRMGAPPGAAGSGEEVHSTSSGLAPEGAAAAEDQVGLGATAGAGISAFEQDVEEALGGGAPALPAPADGETGGDAPGEEADALVAFPPEAVIDETSAEFMCEAREHIANAEQSLLDLESDLGNTELINTVFRAFHTIKGVAGFLHLTPIVRLTHAAETLLDQARGGRLAITAGHLDLLLRACDVLGQLIGAIQGGASPTIAAYEALMERLDAACGSRAASRSDAEPAAPTAPRTPPAAPTPSAERTQTEEQVSDTAPAVETAADAPVQHKAAKVEQTVKVNTARMDALVDMVGELVIGYQMVYQDQAIKSVREQKTQRTLGHVAKIIRDLQEVAMSLRLVALRPTFQKMSRLVRDVSAKSGKSIRFHVEGEDVELDRTVVEEIADPLVHMIRNACDHGIEASPERRAAGKSAEGNLWLRAYHQGGSIVVEIADDGRGLNRERILRKAIEKGLYSPERELTEIPDAEVYNLVFLPGFSTAEQVTDISGRGVGMDVVRRNIEALRGTIEISSEPGRGSTFRMRLPLTMAIIDGMIVRVGSQRYVIPTLSIEQSFRPRARDIHTVVGRGETVQVRGTLLPVYRAKRVFGLGEGVDDVQEGLLVVLEAHDARFCLLVDEIVGQQQVVIKSLGHGLAPVRGVSGGAILGDGRVALILDVAGVMQEATRAATAA